MRKHIPRPEGWLRFESGWLNVEQALGNLETAVSLVQTISQSMVGIANLTGEAISNLHQGWNEGDKSLPPAEEMGSILARSLDQIDDHVRTCRFHGRGLIDGQTGVVGVGRGLDFVRGGPHTASSPPEGYEVKIDDFPSRASLTGGVPLHRDWLNAEQELFLAEGERFLRYTPGGERSIAEFLDEFQQAVRHAGLDLEVGLTRQRRLIVRHAQHGSQFKFKGCSRHTPLLSSTPGKIEWSRKGKDIQGALGNEPAFGVGRMLVGYLDNPHTSELAVIWRGVGFESGASPRVHVVQNGIRFQDDHGPLRNPRRISLPSFFTFSLGRWVENRSGFRNLSELRVDTWQAAADSLQMLFAVSCEVDEWKERTHNWIQQFQSQALDFLRRNDSETLGLQSTSQPTERVDMEQMAQVMRRLIESGRAKKP